MKDGDILTGHYNSKKVLFYDYNFKKLNENNSITTPEVIVNSSFDRIKMSTKLLTQIIKTQVQL